MNLPSSFFQGSLLLFLFFLLEVEGMVNHYKLSSGQTFYVPIIQF
ncbi:hypothetical protein L21SP2_2092 [Salinispira pacifica]|uniref:Uncharacterized protein n=1 Tax=Salinispira pacifica TaxID=1307761 RepID=V5WIR7_9SPIO|nr:hypothetical protein L21SP2_2092 [Salinispira pacifica]